MIAPIKMGWDKGEYIEPTRETIVGTINELVGVVNALVEESNTHEQQIDKLAMKLEPDKAWILDEAYHIKSKWIGSLVEYKDSYGNYKYGILTDIKKGHEKYPYVIDNEKYIDDVWLPDESVFYKGD